MKMLLMKIERQLIFSGFCRKATDSSLQLFRNLNFSGSFFKLIYHFITPEVALFATVTPFRNTFLASLGVAKRGTSGVIHHVS